MTSDITQLAAPSTAAAFKRATAVEDAVARQASFQDHLSAAQAQHGTPANSPATLTPAKARKVAGDLVANALIMPVLKQLRRGPWSDDPLFGGGIGEKTFGPEFDIHIADRIAHSPMMKVTDTLAARLLKAHGQNQTKQPPSDGHIGGVDVHG